MIVESSVVVPIPPALAFAVSQTTAPGYGGTRSSVSNLHRRRHPARQGRAHPHPAPVRAAHGQRVRLVPAAHERRDEDGRRARGSSPSWPAAGGSPRCPTAARGPGATASPAGRLAGAASRSGSGAPSCTGTSTAGSPASPRLRRPGGAGGRRRLGLLDDRDVGEPERLRPRPGPDLDRHGVRLGDPGVDPAHHPGLSAVDPGQRCDVGRGQPDATRMVSDTSIW